MSVNAGVSPMAASSVQPCEHKPLIGCALTALPSCCACADQRPMASAYPIYVDGKGMRMEGRRWHKYCWRCRDYFNQQQATHNTESTSSYSSPALPGNNMDPSFGYIDTRRRFQHRNIASSIAELPEAITRLQDEQVNRMGRNNSRLDMHHGHPMASLSPEDHMRLQLNQELHNLHMINNGNQLQSDARAYNDTLSRRNAPVAPQTYPLGTREDVEQENYQSPLAGMFSRAWDRYRTAEEVRQAHRSLNPNAQAFYPVPAEQIWPRLHEPNGQTFTNTNSSPSPSHHMSAQQSNAVNNNDLSGLFARLRPRRVYNGSYVPIADNPFQRHPGHVIAELPADEPLVAHSSFNGDGPNVIDLQARPQPLTAEEMKVDISCKICHEQKIDTLTIPCYHFTMCRWCAQAWEDDYRQRKRDALERDRVVHRCPLCRGVIKETRRVHLA